MTMSIEWSTEVNVICDECGRSKEVPLHGTGLNGYIDKSAVEKDGWLIEAGDVLCDDCSKEPCEQCGSKNCVDEECCCPDCGEYGCDDECICDSCRQLGCKGECVDDPEEEPNDE